MPEVLDDLSAREIVKVGVTLRSPHSPEQKAFVECTALRQMIRAGRRFGKTVGAGIKAVEGFLGICPKCHGEKCAFCGNRGKVKPVRVLYAAPTAEQVGKFWFEINRALSPGIDSGYLSKNETEKYIERPGTEIRIKAKTAWNANTMRGDYAGLLILEEYQLMNEDAWEEVGQPMLLDNNGTAVFIYTPPSLKSQGVSKAKDPRHAAKLFKKASEDTSGRWQAFHFTSYQNPTLDRDALNEIAGDMNADAYRREILAEDDEIQSSWLVYSLFNEEKCRIKRFDIPKEWPIITSHDFGCVDDETDILTKRGWKRQGDLIDGDITLTFNLKTGQSEWQPILEIYRFQGRPNMRLMEQRGHNSFTTLNHRWAIEKRSGKRVFTTTENLKSNDRVLTVAKCSNLPKKPVYSDSFVELVGWFWTEGQLDAGGVSIWQNEGEKAEQIRRCLRVEFGEPLTETRNGRERAIAGWVERPKREGRSPRSGLLTGNKLCHFAINLNGAERIIEVAPHRVVKPEFIASLTSSQLKLFIETSIKGDGWNRRGRGGKEAGQSINQSKAIRLEPFQMACSLLGIRFYLLDGKSNGRRSNLSLYKRKHLYLSRAKKTDIVYDGLVWCPTTPNGTWFARRKGTVYFTGNSANPAALFLAKVKLPLPKGAPLGMRYGDYVLFREYAPGGGFSSTQHIEKFRELTADYKVEHSVGGNITTEDEIRQGYSSNGWTIGEPPITRVNAQIDRAKTLMELDKLWIVEDLYGLLGQIASCLWELDTENKPLNKVKNESRYHFLSCLRYMAAYLPAERIIRDDEPEKIKVGTW